MRGSSNHGRLEIENLMRMHYYSKISLPPSGASRTMGSEHKPCGAGTVRQTSHWSIICGLLLGVILLGSCSNDQPRSQNSEMRVNSPSAVGEAGATPVAANSPAAESSTEPLPGASGRYRVVVGAAYFFDQPQQSSPNGRYLRRGDAFYGEGETNGFVKTGFVQPNGVAGTAWLKLSELRKFASDAAAAPPRTNSPRQVAHTPATPVPNLEDRGETSATEAQSPPERHAETAVVQVARAYFYQSPDLLTLRKAFCQRGDKVQLGEIRGAAVYVTFTNWEKVTTTGWMRKDALR